MANPKNHHAQEGKPTGNMRLTRRHIISLKSRAAKERTWPEIAADWLAGKFGTITFFVINAIWFTLWITHNSGSLWDMALFDPFPFSFLTLTVSLEAIFLSIIVLISQNRAAKVDQLRDEIDLNLDLIAEQEITKIMQMLAQIMEKQGIDISKDATLQDMLKPTNAKKIEDDLRKQL